MIRVVLLLVITLPPVLVLLWEFISYDNRGPLISSIDMKELDGGKVIGAMIMFTHTQEIFYITEQTSVLSGYYISYFGGNTKQILRYSKLHYYIKNLYKFGGDVESYNRELKLNKIL